MNKRNNLQITHIDTTYDAAIPHPRKRNRRPIISFLPLIFRRTSSVPLPLKTIRCFMLLCVSSDLYLFKNLVHTPKYSQVFENEFRNYLFQSSATESSLP